MGKSVAKFAAVVYRFHAKDMSYTWDVHPFASYSEACAYAGVQAFEPMNKMAAVVEVSDNGRVEVLACVREVSTRQLFGLAATASDLHSLENEVLIACGVIHVEELV